MIKIVFIGDIVGRVGRDAVHRALPEIVKKYNPDFILANGENLASGKGVTPKIYKEMTDMGIDLLTGGNHMLKRDDIDMIIDDLNVHILRPANWPADLPGRGFQEIEKNGQKLLVVNLQGQIFMPDVKASSPFEKVDEILKDHKSKFTLVDLHAEATSEKRALAEYLDGRVSVVLGTHTHIATADEKVLPRGTAFITDVGMSGASDSILGVKKEIVIRRMTQKSQDVFEVTDSGPAEVNGIYVELKDNGLAQKIERIHLIS